jgi:signal transduction histidine kinase
MSRPWRSQSSLVRRLVWLASLWIIAALLVTGVALTAFFQQSAIRRFDQNLSYVVDALLSGTNVAPDGSLQAPLLTDARTQRAYSGQYWQVAVIESGGRLRAVRRSRSLFDAELTLPPPEMRRLQAAPGTLIAYDIRGPLEEPLRATAVSARLSGFPLPVVFMAAEDRTPIDEDARRFAATTAAALVALGIGLVIAVFAQVRIGLRPMFEVRREVARVRKGKAQRLTGVYPEELAPLANELNALLDHNQEVVERQRTHVGNLAHALKTPISVLLTEARRTPVPWPRSQRARPTPCAITSTTICGAREPPPGRKGRGSAPRWPRCWRS